MVVILTPIVLRVVGIPGYIYIPGTQMTLVLIIKDLVFEGPTPKTRDKMSSRYNILYIYIFIVRF